MKGHFLKETDRALVEQLRAYCKDKDAYQKLSILIMLDEGFTLEKTSMLLGISLGKIHNCKQKYETEGLSSYLDTNYVPYTGKLSETDLAQLDKEVSEGLYTSIAQINDWVEKQFGFRYSESGLRSILHKLKFSYKKTTSVPGGLDVAVQEDFLNRLEPFIRENCADNEVVCFMDAVHPQHNTRSDYVWAKRGQDKEVRSNTGRKRININGAMNAHAPEDVTVIEADCINAQSTQLLFERLLEKYRNKETIWILADNARYYTNAALKEWLARNTKIKLLHIPPYSPNLNLIERLWKFMRKKVINLKYYSKFEEFKTAVFDFFQNIEQYKSELKTLITPNFQRFSA